MKKPKYALSPNEIERLVKEERERLRKLRIVQVREQAKASAATIRNDVRREKQRLLNKLATDIEVQLTAEKDEKIRKLKQKYEGTLRAIGDGHREAHIHGDGYSIAEQLQKQQEATEAAQGRFSAALKKQRLEEAAREHEQRRHILARQAAMEVEKERASEIASLPPPVPEISLDMEKKSRRAVQMMDMKAYAATHYHIPDYQVVRAGPQEQTDAKSEAAETDLKLRQDLAEKKRSQHEQKERARIRGNEALQKEMLKHDLGDMLQDLSLLQRQDRRRRQKVLADVPKQVFIPPERCLEERQERQIEMERKFDELYMQQFNERGAGDLQSVDISEYPTTQDSASASIHESAETVDAIFPMSRINPALRDLTNVHPQGEATKEREPESVLKQLLTKIKAQRDGSSTLPTPAPQSTDQKPLAKEDTSASVPIDFPRAEDQPKEMLKADGKDDIPGYEDFGSDSDARPVAGNISQAESIARVKGRDSHSDLDSEAISANDRMIEELMKRIKLIELQKQQLSRQFEAQAGALDSLLRPVQSPGSVPEGRSVDASSDLTLREVDIDSRQDSIEHGLNKSGDTAGERARAHLSSRGRLEISKEESSPALDLAAAVSNLRPISGILKGQKNLQYELLTSNGFLPSPEINTGVSADEGRGREGGLFSQGGDSITEPMVGGGGGDAGGSKELKGNDGGGGARREIDFGVRSDGNLLGKHFMVTQGLGHLDSGDGQYLRNANMPLNASAAGGVGQSFNSSAASAAVNSDRSSFMSDKVRQYAEKAEERHAGMDEETALRVRQYQQHLLQKQSDRQQMLAQVRADIEARRRQLYTSKQSFLAEGLSRARGEFGTDMERNAAGSLQQLGSFNNESVPTSVADGNRERNEIDSLEGRGGVLLSSWTSRQQERMATTDDISSSNTSRWEPIRPFIADPRLHSQRQALVPGVIDQQSYLHLYGAASVSATLEKKKFTVQGLDGNKINIAGGLHSSGQEVLTTGKDQRKSDKVRKSLSFEEKEAGDDGADVSRVSWKDVLNDTGSSGKAWPTSEEEESSSPVLLRTHAADRSLDNSSRTGDKSSDVSGRNSRSNMDHSPDISGGDRSSVITGSSSLNGSALVARAEERRVGFERRQAELQQQLLDIQQQKDSILQRYQAGQAALQQQQVALREKLLLASGGQGSGERLETTDSSASLGPSRTAADVAARGSGKEGDSAAKTWAATLAQGAKQDAATSLEQTKESGDRATKRGESSSPPLADATHSGRSSLASAGTQGNASADSFLADISYYKLKNGDYVSLPTSAFQVQTDSSSAGSLAMPKKSSSGTSQRQTWASLLQTTSSSAQPGNKNGGKSGQGITASKPQVSVDDVVLPQKSASPSPPSGLESTAPSSALVLPASALAAASLADHQPHELSTIMEVDTPTSSSATHQSRQQQQQQQNLHHQHHKSDPPSGSNSSQSLSSQSSSTALASSQREAMVIDKFPELPYTFPRPAQLFDLTTAESQRMTLPTGLGSRASLTAASARRSINFSNESSAKAEKSRIQPLVEQSKVGDDEDDNDDDDDLLATPMPFLVDNTPGKQLPAPADTSGDASSFQISGYSDYLREQMNMSELAKSDSTAAQDKARKVPPASTAAGLSATISAGSVEDPKGSWEAARGHLGSHIVERLRQQSREVFGDSTSIEMEGEGRGDQNQSALSGGFHEREEEGMGYVSLGERSSLPSMSLEEVSIQNSSGDGD
ncbi:centrosomal protein [Plakobranchus ocellatus]|uniref:Centrosomal protein n=1 Tax=Plakobranchus ocellatus TaxID=259542 RepID=A0AAV4ANS9_9GAST|nr:centrosomal protein [Plakobranchus ocellatus]